MRFSLVAATAALAGSAAAADHKVIVGKDGLTFEPANLTAAEGDTVTFKFWPKRHSVAQSAFNTPCEPMQNGIWSGFVPVTEGVSPTSFQIEVKNASQPIWYYCSNAQHCQNGMVGVINPPASGQRTLAAYTTAAKNATNNTSPVSAQALGGKLMNSTAGNETSANGTTGADGQGAGSMLTASSGAALTAAVGAVAFLFL